jgi:hypothetical protein
VLRRRRRRFVVAISSRWGVARIARRHPCLRTENLEALSDPMSSSACREPPWYTVNKIWTGSEFSIVCELVIFVTQVCSGVRTRDRDVKRRLGPTAIVRREWRRRPF